MTARIILNPYANRWGALAQRPEAEAALQAAGVEYDLVVSEYPGHGIALAEEAVHKGYETVIAAGGDSTYNEVVNGMLRAAGDNPLEVRFGILPMGTANDLADNLSIPKDLSAAAQVIARGHTRPLDICQVNDRYFVNNSAVGLETAVSVQQTKMKRTKGIVRYLLATLIVIARNPQWHMRLEWDGGEYDGPVTMVSVGNNPRTGGIFYTVPHANPFDGKLSFVHGSMTRRIDILRILPRIMKPGEGNYVEHPVVHEYHCTWLKIHATPETPLHTDGEVIAEAISDLEYRVHPGRVPMLLPVE
ncbi:MAG: diacylglycerol kinase family lipid kinase [Anaerolineae bacterium]|nr:MAG: diacylglycerol kinase family lipid kinase [Anaerolineae bacterium]